MRRSTVTAVVIATLVVIAILAAVGEIVLSLATIGTLVPPLGLAILIPFLVGPLLFLALLALRRKHRGRSRLLLVVTVVVAAAGLGILGIDHFCHLYEPERRIIYKNPMILPLVQWAVVLVVWVGLAIQEAREKRVRKPTDNPT